MPRTRRNQADYQAADWNAFTAAVKALQSQTTQPNYGTFVMAHTHHAHMMQAHLRYTFLPWHREFLLHFEDALRVIDPTVTLPYWDWTQERTLPEPLANAAEWMVTRDMGIGDQISANRAGEVAYAGQAGMYAAFHNRLVVPHDSVHLQIGGTNALGQPLGEMANIEKSPRDVLFWLHHAYLDKLWAEWGEAHPGMFPPDGGSPLTSIHARLEPQTLFTRTSIQVFSTTALDYAYG